MKFSMIKNDKSTYWDEVILFLMIVGCGAAGIFLIVQKPSFWIITEDSSVFFGVIMVLFAAMFIPALIYRLFTNDRK